MKTQTKQTILSYIKKNSKARAKDIQDNFDISRAMIHRHLKKLVQEKHLLKSGKPPLVYYTYQQTQTTLTTAKVNKSVKSFIDQNYLYISPIGKKLYRSHSFRKLVLLLI